MGSYNPNRLRNLSIFDYFQRDNKNYLHMYHFQEAIQRCVKLYQFDDYQN